MQHRSVARIVENRDRFNPWVVRFLGRLFRISKVEYFRKGDLKIARGFLMGAVKFSGERVSLAFSRVASGSSSPCRGEEVPLAAALRGAAPRGS
jgi:hypothetical protein